MDDKFDAGKVIEWLNQQWRGNKVCPICGNNKWGIGERPVEVREFHRVGLVVGGPVYPLITVTCGVCGYTLLFNAIVAQLVEAKPNETISSTGTGKGTELSEEERGRKL